MVIRSPIRSAIRGPLRGALESRFGGAAFDFYVDSVNGSDANNGVNQASAFQTFSAVPLGDNISIGLVAGSTFAESIDTSAYEGVRISGVGDLSGSGFPVCTGLETYSGDWDTSTDRADVNTNVYSFTWTPSDFTIGSFAVHPVVVVNNVMLFKAASLAACQATAGTYYHGGALISGDIEIYVHPYGSTNPNSDGKTYEITDRMIAIKVGDNSTVEWVHAKGAGDQLGSIIHGDNCKIRNVLVTHNPIHDINGYSGHRYRCVALHPVSMAGVGALAIEFYKPTDVAGATGHNEQCIIAGPATVGSVDIGGMGGHDNGSGSGWSEIRYTKCTGYNVTFDCNDADSFVCDDVYMVNGSMLIDSASDGSQDVSVSISNPKMLVTQKATSGRNYLIASVSTEQTLIDGARVYCEAGLSWLFNNIRNLSIQNSAFVLTSAPTGGLVNMNTLSYTMQANFQYNIIESVAGEIFWDVRSYDQGSNSLVSDFNCWHPMITNSGDSAGYRGPNGAGGQTTTYTLAATRSTFSKETNSIAVDPQFADPSAGDFSYSGDLSGVSGIGPDLSVQYSPVILTENDAITWLLFGTKTADAGWFTADTTDYTADAA